MLVAIVTPVFNDWISLSDLIGALEAVELPENIQFSLLVIDDGSSEPAAITCPLQTLHRIREIEIIGLACNPGHQSAIAVGLVKVFWARGLRRYSRHGFGRRGPPDRYSSDA